MLDEEIIAQQQELLDIHRRNLRHLLRQAAQHGGEADVPLAVANSLYEVRTAISQVKKTLLAHGVVITDEPSDEPDQSMHVTPQRVDSTPPSQNTFNISGAIQAGVVNVGGTMAFDKEIKVNIGNDRDISSLATTSALESRLAALAAAAEILPLASQLNRDVLVRDVLSLSNILRDIAQNSPKGTVAVSALEALLDAARRMDKDMLTYSGESLRRVAHSLGDQHPDIPRLATQILDSLLTLTK